VKYVTETIELDQDVYNKLVSLAAERKQTIDDTVTDILKDFINKFALINVEDLCDLIEKEALEKKTYYVVHEGKIVAACEPVNEAI
jgi:macrodomain Ter protein organizer (MatP/YcbG family)